MRVWRPIAVLALGVGLVGCGLPTDAAPRPLEDVPFGLVVPTSSVPPDLPTPSATTYSARLYYVSGTRLVSIDTDLPQASSPQEQAQLVLEALAAGPRPNLPVRSVLKSNEQLSVSLRGSLATVELDQAVLDVTPSEQLFAIGQIVLSLTRVSPIVDVQFTVAQEPVVVLRPDLSIEDGPVTASNYLPLLTS